MGRVRGYVWFSTSVGLPDASAGMVAPSGYAGAGVIADLFRRAKVPAEQIR